MLTRPAASVSYTIDNPLCVSFREDNNMLCLRQSSLCTSLLSLRASSLRRTFTLQSSLSSSFLQVRPSKISRCLRLTSASSSRCSPARNRVEVSYLSSSFIDAYLKQCSFEDYLLGGDGYTSERVNVFGELADACTEVYLSIEGLCAPLYHDLHHSFVRVLLLS